VYQCHHATTAEQREDYSFKGHDDLACGQVKFLPLRLLRDGYLTATLSCNRPHEGAKAHAPLARTGAVLIHSFAFITDNRACWPRYPHQMLRPPLSCPHKLSLRPKKRKALVRVGGRGHAKGIAKERKGRSKGKSKDRSARGRPCFSRPISSHSAQQPQPSHRTSRARP
jgi:hypothetical protein